MPEAQQPIGGDEKKDALPLAETGNASNPSPKLNEAPGPDQLIDPKGEKYLREVASPEDYPDAEDEEERRNSAESEK